MSKADIGPAPNLLIVRWGNRLSEELFMKPTVAVVSGTRSVAMGAFPEALWEVFRKSKGAGTGRDSGHCRKGQCA